MRVLITSSGTPFALDAIRKLGERGHDIFDSDSYAASPDGQPIPGLPPDDAAYHAELTGEPQR